MAFRRLVSARIDLPLWVFAPIVLALIAVSVWAWALATDRNPLPYPDRDYAVFSASSERGLVAMEAVMQGLGQRPRFRIDSDNVQRTVFWSGVIVNHPDPALLARLGDPKAAMGFVVDDPEASATEVAALLRERGFQAETVFDAEPGLPIAFVVTDALSGSALVFRKHVLEMGQVPPRWTPRDPSPP